MVSAQELKKVVAERERTWEDELYYEYHVVQMSLHSPHGRRLIARLAALGMGLARWGERLVRRAYGASAPSLSAAAHRID
jgi:hypothetical protein